MRSPVSGKAVASFVLRAAAIASMLSASSCATLTLNGCRRVTTCGSVVVADCDGQLTCVGGDGSIVHSEPFDPARATCSRCTGPADDGSAAQSRVATHSAVDECGH